MPIETPLVGQRPLQAHTIDRLTMDPVIPCHAEGSRGMTCSGIACPSSSSRMDRRVSRTACGIPHSQAYAPLTLDRGLTRGSLFSASLDIQKWRHFPAAPAIR